MPARIFSAFTYITVLNTKSKLTNSNEQNLIFQDEETLREVKCPGQGDSPRSDGVQTEAKTSSEAEAISATACWVVATLSFKTRNHSWFVVVVFSPPLSSESLQIYWLLNATDSS